MNAGEIHCRAEPPGSTNAGKLESTVIPDGQDNPLLVLGAFHISARNAPVQHPGRAHILKPLFRLGIGGLVPQRSFRVK